ncbi:hypothetical protein [Mycolicibacterium sphagni]|uniref:hypothetical protein n=1 Tax=Mycolicibacterium sphagni TaxID=1786 RepID=UPI001054A86F|nr:hypothetical protein [Mycolicibacterium sphagni]
MSEPGWYPPPLEGAHWQQPAQDYPTTELPPPAKRRNWLVPAALAVGVAGVASAVTLAVVLWPRQATTPAPTPTVAAPAPVEPSPPTTSTPPPTDAISKEVQTSMQKKFDSDPDLSGLRVTKVTLVNKSGNEYKGIAKVRTPDGVSHDVEVDVTSDDNNTLWETPPGALAFAYDKPAPPPAAAPPPPQSSPVENFKICPSGVSGVATGDTSCAFADNVRASWYSSESPTILAYSPVTNQSYVMTCTTTPTDVWPGAKRCVGTNAQGTTLIVYIE